MGNETSLVKDCKLEREVPVESQTSWRLYQSRRRDGSRVSVFVYQPEKQNVLFIENAAKYLKVLRHPSIVKFGGMEKTSDGVWLATEQVTPLENILEQLSSAEIVAGIYSILEALVFLHDRGGLCHNNLNLASVFVGEDGSWKLGGVEYLCRFDQATTSYLAKCKQFRDEKVMTPEEKAGKVDSGHPGWARDAYAFGILVEMLLEYVTDLRDMTKTFEIRVQDECLDADPNRRPKLNTFLQDRLFKNDFLQITNFLKNVTLKSESEKKEFFWDLTEKLLEFPEDILATRLVRPLLSRFVLLDATACTQLLPHLLTPYKGEQRPEYSSDITNPLLSETLFCSHVIPELFKIFHVRDVHIRSVLLQHFSSYVHQFDKEMLSRIILPQILLGIRDTNDELVHLSLHAIAQLVPILGGDIVVGHNRHKLFADATPKFGEKRLVIPNRGSPSPKANDIKHDLSPTPPKKIRNLKDPAKEAERERRKEEAKRRSEERRKKRQERDKTPIGAKVHSDVDEIGKSVDDIVANSKSDWSDWENRPTNEEQEDDSVVTDSDLDRDEELETMEISLKTEKFKKVEHSHLQNDREKRHFPDLKHGAKGALKLKSSKMRTSPPPTSKVNSSLQEEMSGSKSAVEVKGHHRGDSLIADDTETWAVGGEDDQWNSNSWQDLDNDIVLTNKESKHSVKTPSPKRSRSVSSSGSLTPHNEETENRRGRPNSKNKSKETAAPKKIIKPRVADLDIMSLDIKTSASTEKGATFDFFADMQPEIKVDSKGLWGVLSDNKGNVDKGNEAKVTESGSEFKKQMPVVSFAVQDNTQVEAGDGWGDEQLDWDNEEF